MSSIRRQTRHSLPALALIVLAALAAPVGALAQAQPEPQTSLPDVEDEVMCPVCGTLLELASESPQAQQERELIRRLIAQGKTKDEIKDTLVSEYGDEVLAVPDDEGFDLAAWIVPVLAFLAAAIAIAVGLSRWRRAGRDEGGDGDEVVEAPEGAEAKKLDEDLARYDL